MTNMLLTVIDLESVGIEFDFKQPATKRGKIFYSIKAPKRSEFTFENGTKFSMSYTELKDYVKTALAKAIAKDYTDLDEIDKDLIILEVRVTTSTWTQKNYDDYMKMRREELGVA